MLTLRAARAAGLVAALLPAVASLGAVSLTFSDKDATPTNAVAGVGATFNVDVFLNLGLNSDRVSGISYRLSASASNVFRVTSRTSNPAYATTFPPVTADNSPSVAPVTLSPTSGSTNLGAAVPLGGADLVGPQSIDVAAYAIQVLSGTPRGTYTLSFFNTGFTGASANPTDNAFATLGTFSVFVPEPATLASVGAIGGVAMIRRRRRAC